MTAKGLSEGIRRFFQSLENGTLLRSSAGSSSEHAVAVPLAEALGGKEFVLIYASAHWCPPCRKYTPQLANWYRTIGKHQGAEVVFLSCDHDETGFRSYFASQPWLAVDYDDDGARETLTAAIQISGIPRLVVLDGNTGQIVDNNAVGKPLDLNRWRTQQQNQQVRHNNNSGSCCSKQNSSCCG